MDVQQNPNPVYPAAVILGLLAATVMLLGLPPLFWHLRNHNAAAGSLVAWIVINNLMTVINIIIWHNDDVQHWYNGVGLCDIEVKIMVARSMALPAATMCILKSLANVMDTSRINLAPSKAQRRRAMILDLTACLGLPLLTMLLHYVVQPTRYAIGGVSGCLATFYESWVTVVLLDVPPLILAVVNVYLAGK